MIPSPKKAARLFGLVRQLTRGFDSADSSGYNLNISQVYPTPGLEYINRFFTPKYTGFLPRYSQAKGEEFVFQPCMKLADVPCWVNARIGESITLNQSSRFEWKPC
jgi:hypothetical protein